MPIILFDLAIIAILLVFLWRGASRGFVLALCGLLAVIIAFTGASFLAINLSPKVAERLEPQIAIAIEKSMDAERQKNPVASDFPLIQPIHGADFAPAIAQSVAYAVIFLLAFVAILVLWTLLSRGLDLVTRLPGLHFLNKTGGAILGLAKGVMLLFIAAWLLRFSGTLIPEETLAQTYLLKFFLETNPITLLTGV